MRNAVLFACAGAALLSSPALADDYCNGTIAHSWVSAAGGVYIYGSWGAGHTQICNVRVEWNGVPPEVCVTWLAKVDAAVSLSRSVTIWYPGAYSCGTLPTYENTPAPGYVMLN